MVSSKSHVQAAVQRRLFACVTFDQKTMRVCLGVAAAVFVGAVLLFARILATECEAQIFKALLGQIRCEEIDVAAN